MNSCSEQLFLVLTNSCATTQLSTATTSEIMLPDIHFPFTHTHKHISNFVLYYWQKGFLQWFSLQYLVFQYFFIC